MLVWLAVSLLFAFQTASGFAGAPSFSRRGIGGGAKRRKRIVHSPLLLSTVSDDSITNDDINAATTTQTTAGGLYRSFAERAWNRVRKRCDDLQPVAVPRELSSNTAAAAGAPEGTRVDMTVKALRATTTSDDCNDGKSYPIRYARFALLETVHPSSSTSGSAGPGVVQTSGIQVLNMVIFPSSNSALPVWGADFVSLPGNKHLLLLDAQPMGYGAPPFHLSRWQEWYEKHEIAKQFPWGGDLPEKVQPYVSQHALWTRLGSGSSGSSAAGSAKGVSGGGSSSSSADPIQQIQGLMTAFEEHLDLYLDLILQRQEASDSSPPTSENRQRDYIKYRLENDPARPMLKRLYGEEWTEKVLHNVLFPQP